MAVKKIVGFVLKPNRKWWIIPLRYLGVIPRKVWLRFWYKSGRHDDELVMVNRLGALRDARDVAFVNDTDAKFFTLIRFTSKAEYQQVRRMAYDAQSEGK